MKAKRTFHLGLLAALALTSSRVPSAADAGDAKPVLPASTSQFSCVASGSGIAFQQVCVSDHGNIMLFQTGYGTTQLANREGYCLGFVGTGIVYYDAGIAESGFSATTNISQPNGPNTYPLTITRTTVDGALKLTQTFTKDNPENDIAIVMKVKNTSGSSKNIFLNRFFDGDLNGNGQNDIYARTGESTFAWDELSDGLALTRQGVANLYWHQVERYSDWVAGSYANCAASVQSTPTPPGDYVGWAGNEWQNVAAGATKVVKFIYRRI